MRVLQLDDPAVATIVGVLEHAQSSYLAPFLDLRNLIHRWAAMPVPVPAGLPSWAALIRDRSMWLPLCGCGARQLDLAAC